MLYIVSRENFDQVAIWNLKHFVVVLLQLSIFMLMLISNMIFNNVLSEMRT